MAITTGNFAKVLWPGVNSFYGIAYDEHATEYTDIFETRSSRKSYEEIVGTSGLGLAAVKPEGQPVAYDNMRQGFTNRFTNITYGLGFIVTREMVDDDLYDVIMQQRARGLAQSIRKTKETVGANVLNNGFDAGYAGGDGVELFSAVHPNVAGGTFANELGTSADLSEAALEQACIDLGNWEDDRGLKIAAMPKKLIIPVDLQFEAERILHTDLRVGTADNDLNAMKSMGKIPQGFRVNHYLTDSDAWFLTTDCPDGLIHFERRGDDFTMDNDFDTENAKYKATGRYSFGHADPRGAFGSPGA